MARKSTTENPAETEAKGEDVSSDQLGQDAADEAGIARAGVVAATHVRYIGTAHVREISKRDWKQAGVDDQDKVVFDNRYPGKNQIPITDFSAGALEYLDAIDDGFVLVDENGKRV